MKKNYSTISFTEWLDEQLKDPALKAEYDALEPTMVIIRAIIEARIKKNFTQKQLAEKMGTKQSVISRLESGNANPSIGFLQKLAQALDMQVEVRFT